MKFRADFFGGSFKGGLEGVTRARGAGERQGFPSASPLFHLSDHYRVSPCEIEIFGAEKLRVFLTNFGILERSENGFFQKNRPLPSPPAAATGGPCSRFSSPRLDT